MSQQLVLSQGWWRCHIKLFWDLWFIWANQKKLMNQLKAVLPSFAALGIYFLALNSPMYQQMNQPHSVEKIIPITIEEFK